MTTEMVGPAACTDFTDEIARAIAWQSMLAPPGREPQPPPVPSVLAAAAAVDGAHSCLERIGHLPWFP